jgi:hypothetical protein
MPVMQQCVQQQHPQQFGAGPIMQQQNAPAMLAPVATEGQGTVGELAL